MKGRPRKYKYKIEPRKRPPATRDYMKAIARAADYLEAQQLKSMREAAEAGLNHVDHEMLEKAVKWMRGYGVWYMSKQVSNRTGKIDVAEGDRDE